MAHIIIIGASTGGLPAAYELKASLGEQHQITVVSNTPVFHFVPSNPWVATGLRRAETIQFALAPVLTRKGIGFYDCGVTKIDAPANAVFLGDGSKLQYDYLIVATGAKLAFDEIAGFGPNAHSQSICTVEHAETTWHHWQQFLQNPGPIVVGAVQGASCFGPAYEYAMMLNQLLRKAKQRHQVPITFVTPEPYIGHLGLGGVGDSRGLFESEFRHNDIQWLVNSRVTGFDADGVVVEQLSAEGQQNKTHRLPSRFNMLIPAFKGVDCVANLGEPAVNPRGFLKVDEFQRNPTYANIYGVGVCIAITPIGKTDIPIGVPKTGYMIESMAKAAVANIISELAGQTPATRASWNAVCLADIGHTGAAFVAMPQIPPRNRAWMKKGRWVQWAKIGFEKYFLYRMKRGLPEAAYERCLLKCFGISKTR